MKLKEEKSQDTSIIHHLMMRQYDFWMILKSPIAIDDTDMFTFRYEPRPIESSSCTSLIDLRTQ